jgi:hypothetical protein
VEIPVKIAPAAINRQLMKIKLRRPDTISIDAVLRVAQETADPLLFCSLAPGIAGGFAY